MTRGDFRFAFTFRIRYSEVDGQSVVFNAHYLTFFDTAITEYFRWMGYDYAAEVKASGIDFHTAKSLVEYKAPIVFDQVIEVGVRIGHIGNSSMRFDLGVFDKASGKLHATGEIVWVYTDQTTHKTVRVPDRIRDMIASADPVA
ncbi:MAG: thioesterase family protein [Beijerinckiaceae bacterium]